MANNLTVDLGFGEIKIAIPTPMSQTNRRQYHQSLYPAIFQAGAGSNLARALTLENMPKYLVSTSFPFDVKRIETEEEAESYLIKTYYYVRGTKKEANLHNTRATAEKERLQLLINWYTNRATELKKQSGQRYKQKQETYAKHNVSEYKNMLKLAEKYKKELEDIEENNPEWFI